MTFIKSLWHRLGEPSSWAAFGVIITGAAAVATPYSYAVIGCGVAGWLLQEGAP